MKAKVYTFDMNARVQKLVGLLDSDKKGEVLAATGKLFDHVQTTGGSLSNLLGKTDFEAVPKGLQKRVRKASRMVCFLTPSERQRLAQIDLDLDDYQSLRGSDLRFLEQIFRRTDV